MKRFLILVGVAVVAAAMYVAASPASQQSRGPTAKQFSALKKQVASLSSTVKALKSLATAETGLLVACDQHAVPIGQFGNPTGSPAEGYHYLLPSNNPQEILSTALDVADSADPNAVFFAYGDSTCNTELGGLRHASVKAGIGLPRASAHRWSFTAHGR